jgi:hypothetical protein
MEHLYNFSKKKKIALKAIKSNRAKEIRRGLGLIFYTPNVEVT